MGQARGEHDLLPRSDGFPQREVVVDGVVEEHRFLGNERDVAAEVRQLHLAHVDAIDGDPAGAGFVEARDEIGEGAFAGAAGADERADGAGLDRHIDVLQGGRVAVGKGHVLEGDATMQAIDRQGMRRIGDRDGFVEDIFEAGEGSGAAVELAVQVAEFLDRLVAKVERADDREEGLEFDARVVGEDQRGRDADGGEELDDGGEGLRVFHDLHLGDDQPVRGLAEAGRLALLEAEGPDLPRGGKVFVQLRGDIAQLLLDLARAFHHFLAHVMHGQDGEGHDGETDQHRHGAVRRESLPDQETQGAEECHGLLDAVIGDQGQRRLQLGTVGNAAGKQVTARFLLDEGKGQHLELAEEIQAHGLQDADAGQLDVVAVEETADRPEQEEHGHRGGNQDHGGHRHGVAAAIEDHRKDVLDQQRQAQAVGRAEKQPVEDRRRQRGAVRPEVAEIGAETAEHEIRRQMTGDGGQRPDGKVHLGL